MHDAQPRAHAMAKPSKSRSTRSMMLCMRWTATSPRTAHTAATPSTLLPRGARPFPRCRAYPRFRLCLELDDGPDPAAHAVFRGTSATRARQHRARSDARAALPTTWSWKAPMATTRTDRSGIHRWAPAPTIRETAQRTQATWLSPPLRLNAPQELLYYQGIRNGPCAPHPRIPRFTDGDLRHGNLRRHRVLRHRFPQELEHGDPFGMPGLHFTRETGESMAINAIERGGDPGRLGHVQRTGAPPSQAQSLASAAASCSSVMPPKAPLQHHRRGGVSIFHREIAVRARIWTINEAPPQHADQQPDRLAGQRAATQGVPRAWRVRARHDPLAGSTPQARFQLPASAGQTEEPIKID